MENKYPLPTITDEIRQQLQNKFFKQVGENIEGECIECNQKKENNGQ